MLFSSLPRILLSPIAGAVADRMSRRLVMILADSGAAVITLAAALLLASHNLEVWHIYAIATLYACLSAFQEPAYTASISMLIPKAQLARANGMVQMGQAAEMIVSPILAGALYVSIGFRGIILIDFATYFFAIAALLWVQIPQPKAPTAQGKEGKSIWRDAIFGWRYLRARSGLLGLLFFYALVNFFFNLSAVLMGPMVLSFASASSLGMVQTLSGVGMLAGSVLMSVWGGPKRRIYAVFGFIALGSLGLAAAGIQPSTALVSAGLFILMFSVPLASGPSQAIFQSKVAPAVQGRVFAIRSMVARSTMPLAFLSTGPLADHLFEPLLRPGGNLASGLIGELIGVGPGRGMGLMMIISGLTLLLATALAFANPRIRHVEEELPDAVADEASQPNAEAVPTMQSHRPAAGD
jgi:MFS family permease